MNASPHLVIVGGGLSGLTAAFYLQRTLPAARITLLEARSRLGGVIRSERIGGYLVEHGADMFSTQPGDVMQLCRDLGLEDQLIEPLQEGRGAMVVRGGRCYPVPEGFVLMRPTRWTSMFRTPLLSAAGKLRLLAEPLVRRRHGESDESVADFVQRRLGKEAFERIVQPLVGGIYTADPYKLSMQATMPQFLQMEQQHGSLLAATRARKRLGTDSPERSSSGARYGQFRGFPGGMRSLVDALLAQLPEGTVQTDAMVERIERIERIERDGTATDDRASRWRVQVAGAADPLHADGLLLALPAPVFGSLLEDSVPAISSLTRQIEYASAAIVVLGVRNEDITRPLSTFGIVVPEVEQRKILACSFASHKFPGRTPAGHTLLRVFTGGALHPEMLDLSDDRLIEIVRQELGELIGLGEPDLTRVVRWREAMPQYHLGHKQRAAAIEEEVARLPGLELAGNALHGVGIAAVIGTARRAAVRLAETIQG